ncbi:hypothetical protein A176_006678 [Myxococcus hansupus]|uniref:Uncharacterized protein n=1 Tax=Pseudomyxococcus hansupus TaxID=1297742 RepID=A0A0H4X278_9BACT|nr:hypothetical protein A176_006678 [Myxococcus hansupus]
MRLVQPDDVRPLHACAPLLDVSGTFRTGKRGPRHLASSRAAPRSPDGRMKRCV